jgi:thymidylate synthase (FAD)
MGYIETSVGSLTPVEVFRAPRISLIARPQFVEPEHLPVQWRGDASDGERLAEFAGRLCYMSQHNPVNRTTAEYLENIRSRGTARCSNTPCTCC